MTEKDDGANARPIPDSNPMGFENAFPSPTKGDGLLRPNNLNTGAGQGKGGNKKKVRCQICGFLIDVNKVDYSGGSEDGQGAGGSITETTDSGTLNNGETYSETYGEQAYKKNAGCPLCFSKNGSKVKNITQAPTPRPRVGF